MSRRRRGARESVADGSYDSYDSNWQADSPPAVPVS